LIDKKQASKHMQASVAYHNHHYNIINAYQPASYKADEEEIV
jgi:hypothetical protein